MLQHAGKVRLTGSRWMGEYSCDPSSSVSRVGQQCFLQLHLSPHIHVRCAAWHAIPSSQCEPQSPPSLSCPTHPLLVASPGKNMLILAVRETYLLYLHTTLCHACYYINNLKCHPCHDFLHIKRRRSMCHMLLLSDLFLPKKNIQKPCHDKR